VSLFSNPRQQHSPFKKQLLMLLVGISILILGGSIAVASGATEGGAGESEAAGNEVIGKELPGRRTETSDTYLLPDGKMRTELFEAPVNYRDEEGKWQPIEAGLEERPSGAIVNGDNSFDLHLPESLDEGRIQLSTADAWVSEKPIGIDTQKAELEGEAAVYDAAAEGVSFQFSGLADGLKEDIVLEDASAPSTLHFLLEASQGLTPSLNEAGGVDFRDEEGNLATELPAPVMSDSASTPNVSNDVHYDLQPTEGGVWNLTVQANQAWLSDPSRVFPVKIDPTITTVKIAAPALDCAIVNGGYSETSFCGASGWQSLGVKAAYKSTGTDEYWRTLLRFNLSSIPKTASIISATMGIYSPREARNVYGIELANADKLWDSTVNWKYYAIKQGGKREAWTTEGGDYGSQMAHHQVGIGTQSRGNQAGWWNFTGQSLTWLVQRWLSGATPNNGVLLKLMDERWRECCIERVVEFQSSATANKPYLSVEYIPPAPIDSKVTSPTEGTRSARRFKLAASWAHAGVTGIKWQYKSELGWVDIPASKVMDKNGQTLKAWPYAVEGGEQHSEPLYWDASEQTQPVAVADGHVRAVLIGVENAGGYTQPVEVGLNRDIGGPKDAITGIGPGAVDLLTGNFTYGRNDISVPELAFGRTLNSRDVSVKQGEQVGVLGQGWKPSSPVEVAGGSAWREVQEVVETEEGEGGETYEYRYAILTGKEGNELSFEVDETTKSFITPPELAGYLLVRIPNTTQIALTDPDGNRTVFDNGGSGSKYLPVSVSTPGGSGNKTVMNYEFVGSSRRLNKIVAPTGPGVSCSVETSTTQVGCRTLIFTYQHSSEWGGGATMGDRLTKITYYAASSPTTMGSWDVAAYSYNAEGRLISETDPRTGLKETYTYTSEGQLKTIAPPGEEPWTMQYGTVSGEVADGRLISLQRASLIEGEPTAQTTIAYNVPVSGSGAPYDMGSAAIAKWGQTDFPTDATAIFPPSEVPANPPSSYAKATVYYMDVEGQLSNVATPAGAGMEGPSISTMETDEFGNEVRELSPQNRLRALAAGEGSVAKSHELETKFRYSADGIDLQEEWGPMHQVRLESGETISARLHRTLQYEDPAPPAEEPRYHLPTRETTGASIPGRGEDADQRVAETHYDWTLRQPTETTVDPGSGHLNITAVAIYDKSTGLPLEIRQPSNKSGGGAGTTKFVYYNGGTTVGTSYPECENKPMYAGQLCKTLPAAQPPSGQGRPELLVKTVKSYNQYGEPTEIVESPGGGTENIRKTLFTYDSAGRLKTRTIEGGGQTIPKVEMTYSSTNGAPTSEKFVCNPLKEACTGFDNQAVTTAYDALGRVSSYEDADGNKATTTYDLLNRPVKTTDTKGSQTVRYDSISGLPVELEDSAAGKFTASYNADGAMTRRTLPDGLTAETTYDPTGAATHLSYTKSSNCGESCLWLDFGVEMSINGQILNESSSLATHAYGYDRAGRLVAAQETPQGGGCTTRLYTYDEDSNRKSLTTRSPGVGGACANSGGSAQSYEYDAADRIMGNGLAYDSFGRVTNLPGAYAGGNTLTTGYFADDMVASQSQNGVTNTFQLDASLRQRLRLQAGGVEGSEIFHYDEPSDSPAWTERGSTWTRNIVDLGGELAAVQDSVSGVTLDLTNLHGDVMATAEVSPSATKLKATFGYDEFGKPASGSAGRFAWLGGQGRRTELPSGVIQMGQRSYVPALGRFLSGDPVRNGSASAYDYANQDPVNNTDLGGENTGHLDNTEVCKGTIILATDYLKYNKNTRDGYGKLRLHWWVECNNGPLIVVSILKITQFLERTDVGYRSYGSSHAPKQFHGTRKWGTGPKPIIFSCINRAPYKYVYEFQWQWNSIGGVAVEKDGNGPATGGGGSSEMHATATCGEEWT
jgi:RHS repeat-associated protein